MDVRVLDPVRVIGTFTREFGSKLCDRAWSLAESNVLRALGRFILHSLVNRDDLDVVRSVAQTIVGVRVLELELV